MPLNKETKPVPNERPDFVLVCEEKKRTYLEDFAVPVQLEIRERIKMIQITAFLRSI